tara:strand:- start:12592 stop:13194 length:603 start_codon:yes stop_codon:yes gene_type:complete
MKSLVIIPARGGSKRLPGKNIKLLNGKPLIQYTIEYARKIFDDDIICMTTDSVEIKKVVENIGLKVPFLRPKEFAKDSSSTDDVIRHTLKWYNKKNYKPEIIILLQPTSPFRKIEDIKKALKKFSNEIDMVVSVKKGYKDKLEYNGSLYIINVNSIIKKNINQFTKVKKYVMHNPIFSIDIDTDLDWKDAKNIISENKSL